MLPDIDGFQILKMIREKYTFPVIMLTATAVLAEKPKDIELNRRQSQRHLVINALVRSAVKQKPAEVNHIPFFLPPVRC